jgi:predicted AAA+ superfamily ATPase
MSFSEFLENLDHKNLVQQIQNKDWKVLDSFHEKLIELLRLYYFIGGMPEVVANYIENKNLETTRTLQKKLLIGYENDFGKYAPNEIVPKIKLVWNFLISQLAKENKKFIYGQIKNGARAKDFEAAINWLVDAGLVLKVNRIEKPILSEFKGALSEQYVCQELTIHHQLFYWSSSNTAEIDFIIQNKNEVVPIEVKAEENLKSKSLKVFVEKFENQSAIRTSMSKFRKEDWLTNIPLYAINGIFK